MRRKLKRFRSFISLAALMAGLVIQAHADDSSYDAAVYREMQSATPTLNPMIGAATQESLRLATGGLAPRSPDFEALLGHPDDRFTTFSDQKVPLKIRYLEFMRQDFLRTLGPMQEFSGRYQQCGLLQQLTPENIVTATYRAQTLRTTQCIKEGMARALKVDNIAESEEARVSQLRLPPRSAAALRQYFVQRSSEWAQDYPKILQTVSGQVQALESCVKFIDEHASSVDASNGQLVFDDPVVLIEWQSLQRGLEASVNSR